MTGADAGQAALEALPEQADPARVFGLYLPREETCLTVKTREPAASERLAAGGVSPAAAGLSVTLLHELLFSEALGLEHDAPSATSTTPRTCPTRSTAPRRRVRAARSSTRHSSSRCATSPTGEVMPQKSTYYYPKLLTGLVYDALGD